MKIVVSDVIEDYRPQSKLAWLLILLALLINCALLFLLFILQTDYTFFRLPLTQQNQEEAPVLFEQTPEPLQALDIPPPQPQQHEVAALKPGASNFGAPDDYKDDEIVARIPEMELKEEIPEPELNALTATENQLQEEKPPSQPRSESHNNEKEQEVARTQPITPTSVEKNIEQPQHADQSPNLQQKPPKNKEPKIQEKIKAPVKKELTFNDIARGFLSSLDQGGQDLVERKGNENIRPDFEEMRILSYQHKIFWALQNEWRRINLSLNYPVPPFAVTGISMTVDKDGNLKKATVIHSCGIQQLDEAIMQGIRAASPFPPLPNFLNKESYTFEFGVKHVQSNQSGFNNHFRR